MNTLRLLTLSLVAISISLSDANSMKRPRSESKENQPIQGESDNKRPKFVKGRVPVVLKEINTLSKPKVDGLFKIICRDGLVISDIPLSVLQESGIMLQMAQSAKSDTIALKQYPKDLLTNVIIPCMNFLSSKSITSSSPSMKRGSLLNSLNKDARIKELSRRLFQSCFKGRQKADLKTNQALVLNILSSAHNLEIPELVQATLLIIEQNFDIFFTWIKTEPLINMILHRISEPIKQYLDEIFSKKYNAESLDIVPLDIINSEVISRLTMSDLCNFALTKKSNLEMVSKFPLDLSYIQPVFSRDAHSIPAIKKLVTFLKNDALASVDFKTPTEYRNYSLSGREAVLKTLLLIWTTRKASDNFLQKFLLLPEVQLVIEELINDDEQPIWLSVTVHNREKVSINIRDIIFTVMFWASRYEINDNRSIQVFFETINANIFTARYQQELYECICDNRNFTKHAVIGIIRYAIKNNMPYFLNYFLRSEQKQIANFIHGDIAKEILAYTKSNWDRNTVIRNDLKNTLLRHYHDIYEIQKGGKIRCLA